MNTIEHQNYGGTQSQNSEPNPFQIAAERVKRDELVFNRLLLIAKMVARFEIVTCPTCGGEGYNLIVKTDACHRCGGVGEIVDGDLEVQNVRDARAALKAIKP